MKKLLSAVTSLVTAATFVSSAFTSSLVVSAAGSVPAVQPNVSMDGVKDVTANKNASNADYVFDFNNPNDENGYWHAEAGQSVDVDMHITVADGARKVTSFGAEVAVEGGITVSDILTKSPAFGTTLLRDVSQGTASIACPSSDGHGIIPKDGDIAIMYTFDVPAGTPDGLYEISFVNADLREEFRIDEHTANTVPYEGGIEAKSGYIQVGDVQNTTTTTKDGDSSKTTTTTKTPDATTTSTDKKDDGENLDADYVFDFINPDSEDGYWHVNAGESVDVDMHVSVAEGARKVTSFGAEVAVEGGITISDILTKSPAFGTTLLRDISQKTASIACPSSDGHGIIPEDGGIAIMYTFDVPAGTPDGLYEISFVNADLREEYRIDEHTANTVPYDGGIGLKKGYIQVGDVQSTTTTTKATTSTTKATTTTTTTAKTTNSTTTNQTTVSTTISNTTTTTVTTKAPDPADGSAKWVIPTVHAQKGEKVTLDVIVSGDSNLDVSGAEFNISADSVFGKPTASGSSAYDAALEYNPETNEYAFAQGIGKGTAAKDGAVILSIDYTVPADIEAGTYPVTWSDIFVSDTNGLEITNKVDAVDGAIIIDEAIDGEIAWDIPEVTAKPGETVKLDVIVKDTDNAAVPVSGAQFKITADTAEFVSVDEKTAAYDADIENNPKTNEFAFAQGVGKGTAAADGAKVFTLTYTAPTTPGTYPVKWSEAFISDTNGNDITENISLLDGSITVENDVAEGGVSWVIPEVDAEPGDTVTMEVLVDDSSAEGLAVAGAQFAIKADTPIVYNSSVGSDAYDATIVENAKTNEFAFAQGIGKGTAAKDGDKVLVLTYTVPDDCADGKYPVKWSDAFISDTNGNDITAKVKLVDGAINIKAKTTTTTTSASTTSAPTTTSQTATSSQTTTSEPTTSATTTTTVTPASGAIIWEIDRVEAEPGETVTVNMVVKDTNDTKLPVGGAQFVIKADSPIGHGKSSGTPYGAELVGNDTTDEYAFANGKGQGVAAATGDVVISLQYTVPDDCAAGEYPVKISDLFASDTNGLDITKNIMTIDGAIIVKAKTTTTTTTQTTTTTSTTTTTTTTTSPITVAPGNIMWVVDTVTANPGDEVKVNVVVDDQKDSKLAISGAQFIVDSADGVEYVGATGSEGYDATAEVNGKEIAFAHEDGKAVAAADGANVVTLTFKVPDDCEPGRYPVTLTDLFASDENGGLDVSKNILVVDGAIIVEAKSTTTTTSQTTTSTTTTTATTTTTTVTPASGAIIWEIDRVEAEPGETVTVNMVVKDTNNTKLPVGGAQFVIKADSPIGHGKSSGTPYGAELIANDTTDEYAFANGKGEGVAAADGDIVISLQYTVPDDCPDGEYPVKISELFASDTNGLDITKNIMTIDGAIIIKAKTTTTTTTSTPTTTTTTSAPTTTTTTTSASTTTTTTTSATTTTTTTTGDIGGGDISNTTTTTTQGSVKPDIGSNTTTTTTTQTSTTTTTGSTTTTTLTYPHYYVDYTTQIGFYFSHDDGRRENGIVGEGGFSKEQVTISKMYKVDYEGATPTEVTFDPEKITFNGATPASVYDKANQTFKYEVPVFYDFGENGEEDIRPLLNEEKNQIMITVYIGVKGDVNLDNRADAVDATQIQVYYAHLSAGNGTPKDTQLSLSSDLVDGPDSDYDHFAAFLGDVNANEWSETNWKLRKEDRPEINAVDATQIQVFYARASTSDEDPYDIWNYASPSRFGATD